MLKQMAMIAITGSAATLLMMTGNFDLSTGSTVACTAVLYTLLATHGVPYGRSGRRRGARRGPASGVVNGTFVARVGYSPVHRDTRHDVHRARARARGVQRPLHPGKYPPGLQRPGAR